MTDREQTEPKEQAEAPTGPAITEKAIEGQAPALGGRQVSDTLGTGSGCAIGCTMLAIAIIAAGILVFIITR